MAIVKSKLLKQLKKNWPNLTLSELNKFTEIILSEIKRALRRNERVEIRGWGTLSVKIQKSSIRRNPKTNQKISVSSKRVIRWKMSKELFRKLNNNEG